MADKVKKDSEILNGRLWDHSDNSLQEIILSLKKTLKNNDTIFSQSSLLLKEKKKKNPVSLLLSLKNACTNFLEL